jgi:hypothetical protein
VLVDDRACLSAGYAEGGWFHFDRLSSQPLTKILPPLIHIPASKAHVLGLNATLRCGRQGPYIEPTITRLSEQQGGDHKISCAGAQAAHDAALDYLTRL